MDLNQQTRNAWNQKAVYWDERMGEGNLFQRVLVGPATERLLQLEPDKETAGSVGQASQIFCRCWWHGSF